MLKTSKVPTMSGFSLKSDNALKPTESVDFAARCSNVFASLDSHAPKTRPESDREPNRAENRSSSNRKSSKTSDYRGRESIFRIKDSEGFSIPRRPDLPRFQRGGRGAGHRPPSRVPDHVNNPRGYTKYSLADVEELSDRGNARAAFDFLRERAQILETDDTTESSETEPAKFTIKRPVKKRDASEMEESAPKSSGGIGGFGKRVLPECVVGVDPKQGKKKFEPKKIRVADETDDTESSTKSDVSEEEPPAKKKSKASSSKLSFQFEDE